MRIPVIALALSALLIGCQERQPVTAPATPAAPVPPPSALHDAYLSVSTLTPEAGGTVVVAGTVGLGGSLSVASFVAHLDYDASALHFMNEIELPDMMRVVNPLAGQVIVAGASSTGSANGRLFKLRFRVDNPAGLGSLALRVTELNDREFISQLAAIKTSPALRLDPTLVSTRLPPR